MARCEDMGEVQGEKWRLLPQTTFPVETQQVAFSSEGSEKPEQEQNGGTHCKIDHAPLTRVGREGDNGEPIAADCCARHCNVCPRPIIPHLINAFGLSGLREAVGVWRIATMGGEHG
jgi:hypothetical protein